MKGRHPKRVFAHANGRPLGYKFALKNFTDAVEAAGFGEVAVDQPKSDGYIFHDYRRETAHALEHNPAVSRTAAKKITGHKTDHVFEQYAASDHEDAKAAIRARYEALASDHNRDHI